MSRPGGSAGLTHIFSELTSQDELNVPLGRSARLRYTCLSVCGKYVALGSNSGGTYIFSRDTLKYLQVVFSDTNAVPVDLVSLSPSDHLIGLGLSNGQVTVFELNIEKRSKPERVRQTLDHSGHGITVMTWDSTSTRLYVGDDTGKISVISVPTNKPKTLFSTPSQVIALLESSVYQIQWWKEKLLVSTVTHSHLFDTSKHTYSTIGTKPRAGEFGSCFFLEPNSQVPVIYCARPGSRMWEVSFEGKVLNTHQFKQLMAVPPVPVVRSRSETFDFTNDVPYQGLSTSFLKMFSMGHFIITWSSKGLYMFDPINVKLAMWTQSIKGIKDVCVHRNDIYLFLENTTVRRLTVLPVYQLFTVLASRNRWSLIAQMLLAADTVNFRSAALKRVKRDLLFNIYQGLKQDGKEQLLEKVRASMEDVSEGSVDSLGPDSTEDFLDSLELKGYIFLSSGMVVREGLGADGGGGGGGPAFERYIPPQEQLPRSVSDESFYREEVYEEKREGNGNEEGLGPTEKITGIEQQVNSHDSSLSEGLKSVSPASKIQVQNEQACTDELRKDQTKSIISWTVGDPEEYADESEMVTELIVGGDAEKAVGDSTDKSRSGDKELQLNHRDSGLDSPDSREMSGSQSETVDNFDKTDKDRIVDQDSFRNNTERSGENTQGGSKSLANDCKDEQQNEQSLTKSSEHHHSGWSGQSSKLNGTLSVSPKTTRSLSPSTHSLGSGSTSSKSTESLDTQDLRQMKKYFEDDNQGCAKLEQLAVSKPVIAVNDVGKMEQSNIEQNTSSAPTEAHQVNACENSSLGSESNGCSKESKLEKLLPAGKTTDRMAPLEQQILTEKSTVSDADKWPHKTNHYPPDSHKNQSQDTEKIQKTLPGNHPTLARFASVPVTTAKDDDIIAKPHRQTKKKSKLKKSVQDATKGKLTRSASVATESEAFLKREPDYDAISVSTISSVEEEEDPGTKTKPDSRSSDGETREVPDVKKHLAAVISLDERRHSETIPPLVDRLAAARSCEDIEDQLRSSSLTSSGEHILAGSSPLGSLSVLKDGLSLKLRNQTISFIKSLKENNILTKSASVSKLDSLSDQQRPRSNLSISPPPYSDIPSSPPLSPNSDGRGEEDSGKKVLALDTAPLYSLALELRRKLLASPSALLNPTESQTLLARWAREIVIAVGYVSVELESTKGQVDQQTGTGNPRGQFERDNQFESLESEILSSKSKALSGSNEIVFRGSGKNSASVSRSFISNTRSDLSRDSSPNNSSKCDTLVKPEPASGDFMDPTMPPHSSAINWWSIVHAKSPFSVPCEHLELFQWLTTLCWLSGATGDVLSTLDGLSFINSPENPSPDAPNPQNARFSKTAEGDLHESDLQHRRSTGIMCSEGHVISMLRTMMPPNLFETFMEQKSEATIPSLLSLLSDTLTPPNNFIASENKMWKEDEESAIRESASSLSSMSVRFKSNLSEVELFDRNSNEIKGRTDDTRDIMKMKSTENDLTVEVSSSDESSSNALSSDLSEGNGKESPPWADSASPQSQCLQPGKPIPGEVKAVPWWCSERLRQDANLALFTRLLFFLLDHDLVRSAWEACRTREKTLLLTWISLIRCSQDKGWGDIVSSILADRKTKSAVDYLRSGILPHRSAMMGHLLELFKQAPLMASDFCGELSKIVSPVDVLGMCCLTGRPAVTYLMRYFKQAMLDTAAFFRPVKFEQLVKQPEVRHLLLQCLLPALSACEDVSGSVNTSPALATELVNVLPVGWMETVLAKIDSEEEREDMLWLCSQFRYYRLCIALLTQARQWHRLLRWIVHCNDIRLLRNRNCYPEAYLPRDITEWTYLLSCMREKQQQRSGSEQDQSSGQDQSSHSSHSSHSPAQSEQGEKLKGEDERVKFDRLTAEEPTEEEAESAGKNALGAKKETVSNANKLHFEEETNSEERLQFEGSTEDLPVDKNSVDEDSHLEDGNISRTTQSCGNGDSTHSNMKNEDGLSQNNGSECDLDSSFIEKSQSLDSSNDNGNLVVQETDSPWSLTWGNVGYLLLEHLGGAAAINLLVSHMTEEDDDPSQAWGGLGSEFVQACYTSFLLEGQKDQVSHEMLERMSVFMWAKKPGFLSPSVHHAFKTEQNLVEKKQGKETDVQRVFGQVKSLSNQSLNSEYLGGHWGVSTDLSRRCGICNLPLKTVMSLSVQGAVVFPCGHAYHKCCMSASSCPQLH